MIDIVKELENYLRTSLDVYEENHGDNRNNPQEDLEEQKIQHEIKAYQNNENTINIILNGNVAKKKLNSFFN